MSSPVVEDTRAIAKSTPALAPEPQTLLLPPATSPLPSPPTEAPPAPQDALDEKVSMIVALGFSDRDLIRRLLLQYGGDPDRVAMELMVD